MTSCFLLGVIATLITENTIQHRRTYSFYHDAFADDFLNNDAFFRQQNLIKKEFEESFANHQKSFYDEFSQASQSNVASSKAKVTSREDEKYYYYELTFSGFQKEEIVVLVHDGVISFSAEKNLNKEQTERELRSSSSFRYSFTAPKYDAEKNPEIIRKDDLIVLKLLKKQR